MLARLFRWCAARWRRAGSGPPPADWAAALDRIATDLEKLNQETERDFLAVGEKLMEFRAAARQIASDMAALTELISGELGRNASDALARILERSREMNTRTEQSGQALEQVGRLSCHIKQVFTGLRNMVSTFRTLCTLTQIETARLGNTGADFGDLAAEVRTMSDGIQSSGERVLETSSRLGEGIQNAILTGSDLRLRTIVELAALIAEVTDGLKSFEERRQRAVESSGQQATQYQALCRAVDDLVQSIQFHDITRQQIEHVAQALRHLRLQGAGRRRHSAALPPEARVILTLQSSQLSGAAQTFASSIERMERDLEGIAGRAEEMTVASKELMGLSAGEQDSFFGQMEGHCTTILKMVGSCGEAETEMQCMAARLRETIGRIRESVDEIRAIEIRIQRIATNATIRAAHIGVEGSALDVIAGVMRQAALDSNANTEDVAGALDTMTGAADRVSGVSLISGQTLAGAHSGANEAADQIRHTVLELHTSSESSFSRMNQVATLSARLAGEIGTLRGGFSAGGIFADVVGRARAELERIGLESVRDAADGELETAPELESLAQHYTMQTEREVHESVARGPAIAAAVSSEFASGASENGVLGDNVEFF